MFVRPSLVGGTLGRSNWKTIRASSYFVLQQRGGNNNTTTQQNNNNKRRQHYTEYRIITKGFPHYRVSDHDDLNLIKDAFNILHQEVLPEVEGKKTSKKILKQLKSWCARNENLALPFDEDGDEDGDGYATDTSITPENSSNEMEDQDNDNYPLISPEITISSNSSSSSTKSENAANKGKSVEEDHDINQQLDFNNSDYSEDIQSSDGSDNEGVTGVTHTNEWTFLGASMLDSLMGWLEGPPLDGTAAAAAAVAASSSSKQVNVNASSNNKNQTILDIPMQFIDLLTYPEIDPKASKKASFAVLREISFVKQRRKVLFLLTLYMILIRLCSFDLFLVLLFVSNCAMLFLMKNSGKVNVTMAKRAVRQRIGWAKQWAGSLFKNRTNNNVAQNVSGPNSGRKGSNSVNSNNNGGTVNINSSTYANVSTNIGVVGSVKITPTPIQTTNMAKSASQDMLQSGSMSDTTHGGSVSTKAITPKRGVFFRKTGTTSQTNIKEDKIISDTSSLTGSSTQKPSLDFPINSLSSTTGPNSPNLNPQISLPISGGGNVNESSQPSNTAIIQQSSQSSQSPTTRRRFFKRNSNNHNNNSNNSNNTSNNNFTLPNIIPISPLQNGIITAENLSDSISNYKSLSMSSVPTATGGIIGCSAATNGNEGINGSNEGLTAHSAKYSPNINVTSSNQRNSLPAVDNDLSINDTYYEALDY